MVADIALAASIRSRLSPATLLATVSMHLQMNGEPLHGTIEGRGEFAGFTPGASFVSPGEGAVLDASSRVAHRGRWTAVARTEVIGPEGRRVLDVSTTHARRAE